MIVVLSDHCRVDIRVPLRIALIEMFKDGGALLFIEGRRVGTWQLGIEQVFYGVFNARALLDAFASRARAILSSAPIIALQPSLVPHVPGCSIRGRVW